MKRRTVVRTLGGVGGGAAVGLAGCMTRDDDDDPPNGGDDGDPEPDEPDHDGTVRVVTYRSMVTGTNPAGSWLEEAFVEEYPEADLEWVVPESGVEHYIQRGEYDAEIDADVLLGFTVGDLARIDERVGEGRLLRELNRERIDGLDGIREDLAFEDPYDRALAYDTGYVALVYDETVVDEPGSFADLLEPAYEDTLLTQHPGTSMPGQATLLWTIAAADPETAMEYWDELVANGARIHDSWTPAYRDYLDGERPIVVSYSTDPVFAALEGFDASRHRVAFPDGEGYVLPEGMGIFEDATAVDLAYEFLEFVLSSDVQAELARRNVQRPAVADAGLEPGFEETAPRPSESVALSYTELRGTINDWLADWADRFDEHLVERGPEIEEDE